MENNNNNKVYQYLESFSGVVKYETPRYTGYKTCGKMFAEVAKRDNYLSVLVRYKYVTKSELETLDISLANQDKWTLDTQLRIPDEGSIEEYLIIIERAYRETKKEYDEKVKEIIKQALKEDKDYIAKFINDEIYAFEKLSSKWNEFISYEISNKELDDLKSDLQSHGKYNSNEFMNNYSDNVVKTKFIKLIFELVSYIDRSAYGKNDYNEYEDKRVLALFNYRPNQWLENMINYKKYKDLSKVSALARNAISYIISPDNRITAFKTSVLQNFCKFINPGVEVDDSYESLCETIFNYMSFIDIDVVNEKNRGVAYGKILYSKYVYSKYNIENMYWKIQPYKESNLNKDDIKSYLDNNVIISRNSSILKKATNNIFFIADEEKSLLLCFFTDDAEKLNDGLYKRNFKILATTDSNLSSLPKDKAWGNKLSSKSLIGVKPEEGIEFEQKVIFELFDEDIDLIIERINSDDFKPTEIVPESILEDEDDYSTDEDEISTSLNTILYGPPGTGKTYNTVNYAVSIVEKKEVEDVVNEGFENRANVFNRYKKLLSEKKIVFTTFHQNYSYEEFIQGIRANTNNTDTLSFIKEDGIFKDLVERAKVDPKNNYVIIIDEINRGNISRIFGELITLIEDDKRLGKENETVVTLPSKEIFGVPSNVYIIGTMNTADKSIALIDIALRRRFDFIAMYPDYKVIPEFADILRPINAAIYEKKKSADYLIGHAFFTNKTIDDMERIVNKKLIPLLTEYFYSNITDVKEVLSKGGIFVEMNLDTYQLVFKDIEV